MHVNQNSGLYASEIFLSSNISIHINVGTWDVQKKLKMAYDCATPNGLVPTHTTLIFLVRIKTCLLIYISLNIRG